ncbi:MAG: STM4014 family protein [Pseudomonadota bacterium]|nr:STM4014 family protein [Pseudomonadota bacterium]
MAGVARGLVVVAVPGDKRAVALGAAFEDSDREGPRGGRAITWVSWAEALADPACVGARGQPGDWLRVDSPGADDATWHALARLGGFVREVPPGEWRPGRAWARGLATALSAIVGPATHLVPTHPHILAMTDKLACHQALDAGAVPVPGTFEAPATVATLRERVVGERRHAVFVKPRWGSSGAGVLAWRRNGEREQVVTTASLQADGRLLNDKHLHTYTDRVAIDRLLGTVIGDGAIVQRWIPKASADGGPFDLRVLVVDGRIAQRVARVGRGPITNLHLDSARADPDRVLARFGRPAATRVHAACLAAAACFPGHRAIGVDVMVDPGGRPFVLECNAWGDYLPGLRVDGLDSYGVQLRGLFAVDSAEAA